MATTYKDAQVVGTSGGIGANYSTLYSTGASTTAIISNLIIANESSSAVTVRVGLAASAGTPASGAFLLYDVVIAGNDSLSFGPYSLGNTRFLRVSSSAATCTFSAAVAEIS
jgi:hypothetical protein